MDHLTSNARKLDRFLLCNPIPLQDPPSKLFFAAAKLKCEHRQPKLLEVMSMSLEGERHFYSDRHYEPTETAVNLEVEHDSDRLERGLNVILKTP